jgi:hypothetical protein
MWCQDEFCRAARSLRSPEIAVPESRTSVPRITETFLTMASDCRVSGPSTTVTLPSARLLTTALQWTTQSLQATEPRTARCRQ